MSFFLPSEGGSPQPCEPESRRLSQASQVSQALQAAGPDRWSWLQQGQSRPKPDTVSGRTACLKSAHSPQASQAEVLQFSMTPSDRTRGKAVQAFSLSTPPARCHSGSRSCTSDEENSSLLHIYDALTPDGGLQRRRAQRVANGSEEYRHSPTQFDFKPVRPKALETSPTIVLASSVEADVAISGRNDGARVAEVTSSPLADCGSTGTAHEFHVATLNPVSHVHGGRARRRSCGTWRRHDSDLAAIDVRGRACASSRSPNRRDGRQRATEVALQRIDTCLPRRIPFGRASPRQTPPRQKTPTQTPSRGDYYSDCNPTPRSGGAQSMDAWESRMLPATSCRRRQDSTPVFVEALERRSQTESPCHYVQSFTPSLALGGPREEPPPCPSGTTPSNSHTIVQVKACAKPLARPLVDSLEKRVAGRVETAAENYLPWEATNMKDTTSSPSSQPRPARPPSMRSARPAVCTPTMPTAQIGEEQPMAVIAESSMNCVPSLPRQPLPRLAGTVPGTVLEDAFLREAFVGRASPTPRFAQRSPKRRLDLRPAVDSLTAFPAHGAQDKGAIHSHTLTKEVSRIFNDTGMNAAVKDLAGLRPGIGSEEKENAPPSVQEWVPLLDGKHIRHQSGVTQPVSSVAPCQRQARQNHVAAVGVAKSRACSPRSRAILNSSAPPCAQPLGPWAPTLSEDTKGAWAIYTLASGLIREAEAVRAFARDF